MTKLPPTTSLPAGDQRTENNSSLVTVCAQTMAQVAHVAVSTPVVTLPKGFATKAIGDGMLGNKLSE